MCIRDSATTGGDPAHLVGQVELVDSCDRVTTADDRGAVSLGESLGDSLGAVSKVVKLEDAHGAVPEHGLGALDSLGIELLGLGTDVHTLTIVGDSVGSNNPVSYTHLDVYKRQK